MQDYNVSYGFYSRNHKQLSVYYLLRTRKIHFRCLNYSHFFLLVHFLRYSEATKFCNNVVKSVYNTITVNSVSSFMTIASRIHILSKALFVLLLYSYLNKMIIVFVAVSVNEVILQGFYRHVPSMLKS